MSRICRTGFNPQGLGDKITRFCVAALLKADNSQQMKRLGVLPVESEQFQKNMLCVCDFSRAEKDGSLLAQRFQLR
jgi:hypothetical protein